jgi:hypothetical protein
MHCCLLLTLVFSASAGAATFYVRNGGDDSADGRSPATAWATLNKVNAYSFSAGDSVLLHEGDTRNNQVLSIDWSGTSSQRAVIGAYYMDNGEPHVGFRTSRPTLDGNEKVPDSQYSPMVLVTGDHVRVQDLAIVDSEGRGILFNSTADSQAVNLVLSRIYDGAIRFIDSRNGLAEGNSISDSNRAWPETGRDWSCAISALRSSGTVIRNNRIERDFGEGINVFENSPDSLIEGNYIYAARAIGIYADASPNTTIRRNIVVGTTNRDYWRSSDTVGAGIAINNESYHYQGHGGSLSTNIQTTGAKIYDNLVAFTNEGIGVWGQLDKTSFNNTMIYNNTLVDNDIQFDMQNKPMPGSQFVNNILLSISPGTRDVVMNQLNGMVAKNNYFSQGDPNNGLSNPGNRYKGLVLQRMQGWRSISDPNAVSWRDFQVASGSSVIGAGDSTPLEKASSTDAYNVDFNGKPHNAPPDMGGLRFDTAKRVPGRPLGLKTSASPQT